MTGAGIAAPSPSVTGATNDQLDAVNGICPVTRSSPARCAGESQDDVVNIRNSDVTTKRAGMQ